MRVLEGEELGLRRPRHFFSTLSSLGNSHIDFHCCTNRKVGNKCDAERDYESETERCFVDTFRVT